MTTQLEKVGWGKPTTSRKPHYFEKGYGSGLRSLCGDVAFFPWSDGELYQSASGEPCATCDNLRNTAPPDLDKGRKSA